jgi:hypothetical protein
VGGDATERQVAGARGGDDGLTRGDIQRVVELETQGWQHATFGQQIVSKHQEVYAHAEELSRAIARCLKVLYSVQCLRDL